MNELVLQRTKALRNTEPKRTLLQRFLLPAMLLGVFGLATIVAPRANASCVGGSQSACRIAAEDECAKTLAACIAGSLLCPGYLECYAPCAAAATAKLALDVIQCNNQNPCP